MASVVDKRSTLRCGSSISVIFGAFCARCSFFNARAVNHSEDGLCIESGIPLLIGATIFLRPVHGIFGSSNRTETCVAFRTATIAEVKWCVEICVSGRRLFKIGLKYYPPEY